MRGKILRDTSQGDGILFLDGKQKSFSLEKHWKSPNPPKVGATVEATVDEAGELVSVVEVKQAAVLKETALKAGAEFSSQGLSMLKKSKLPPHAAVAGGLAVVVLAVFAAPPCRGADHRSGSIGLRI